MLTTQACIASALGAAALLLPSVQGHGYMLLPETKFTTDKKNYYAYVVPPTDVPPESDYWTGDAEKNAANFKTNYATLNPSSLREFILQYETPTTDDVPSGGTAECGYSIPDADPQPLSDHIEYGNYAKDIIHPGPCEAWCDDEIVVDFAEDCRIYQGIDIPYAKEKCVGKSRLTFYWLATHFSPFQVYISCVPLEGATSNSTSSSATSSEDNSASAYSDTNSTTSATTTSSGSIGSEAVSPSTTAPTATTATPTPTTSTPTTTDTSESSDVGAEASTSCNIKRKK